MPPRAESGLATTLYYLAEHIDDQRLLAWHEARHWNRRGTQLAACSAVGSALAGAGAALGRDLPDGARYVVVAVALIASGLAAAAAAIRAPEKAASEQLRFVALDSLSRYVDYVELVEAERPGFEQRGDGMIQAIEMRLDQINSAPESPWWQPADASATDGRRHGSEQP